MVLMIDRTCKTEFPLSPNSSRPHRGRLVALNARGKAYIPTRVTKRTIFIGVTDTYSVKRGEIVVIVA